MKYFLIVATLLSVLVASCDRGKITGKDYEGIILSSGDYKPSDSEVDSLKSGLKAFLGSSLNRSDPSTMCMSGDLDSIINNLKNYRRRYSGTIENGRKIMLIDAVLQECIHGDEWMEEGFKLLDGGDCEWHLRYDPATNTYSKFRINGSG